MKRSRHDVSWGNASSWCALPIHAMMRMQSTTKVHDTWIGFIMLIWFYVDVYVKCRSIWWNDHINEKITCSCCSHDRVPSSLQSGLCGCSSLQEVVYDILLHATKTITNRNGTIKIKESYVLICMQLTLLLTAAHINAVLCEIKCTTTKNAYETCICFLLIRRKITYQPALSATFMSTPFSYKKKKFTENSKRTTIKLRRCKCIEWHWDKAHQEMIICETDCLWTNQ